MADDLPLWEQPDDAYRERSRAVHWHKAPACKATGPGGEHVTCVLPPRHHGDHYGNGHDEGGPLSPIRWSTR